MSNQPPLPGKLRRKRSVDLLNEEEKKTNGDVSALLQWLRVLRIEDYEKRFEECGYTDMDTIKSFTRDQIEELIVRVGCKPGSAKKIRQALKGELKVEHKMLFVDPEVAHFLQENDIPSEIQVLFIKYTKQDLESLTIEDLHSLLGKELAVDVNIIYQKLQNAENPQVNIFCDNDQSQIATMECSECDLRLCSMCDQILHKSQRRSKHERTPLFQRMLHKTKNQPSLDFVDSEVKNFLCDNLVPEYLQTIFIKFTKEDIEDLTIEDFRNLFGEETTIDIKSIHQKLHSSEQQQVSDGNVGRKKPLRKMIIRNIEFQFSGFTVRTFVSQIKEKLGCSHVVIQIKKNVQAMSNQLDLMNSFIIILNNSEIYAFPQNISCSFRNNTVRTKNSPCSNQLGSPPFVESLKDCQHILLAGCGGGFDIFCCLPLYFALRRIYPTAHISLANLSFSTLKGKEVVGRRYTDTCIRINADSLVFDGSDKPERIYHPEYLISRWFREIRGEEVCVYCFPSGTGIQPLRMAYQVLIDLENIDAIVLCDGGTDSLMLGNEMETGTIIQDHMSIAAVHLVDGPRVKMLSTLGFGIDYFHGVSHGLFLENVSEIIRDDGYKGLFSIQKEMEEARLYMECYKWVQKQSVQPSIVQSSIISAIEGHFGNYHATQETTGSQLFINTLMAIYWNFSIDSVFRAITYFDTENVLLLKSQNDHQKLTKTYRNNITKRKPIPLPM